MMNHLGQERSEVQFAVKELGKEMCTSTQACWTNMQTSLMYLKEGPRAVLSLGYQQRPAAVVAWADSDSAGFEQFR